VRTSKAVAKKNQAFPENSARSALRCDVSVHDRQGKGPLPTREATSPPLHFERLSQTLIIARRFSLSRRPVRDVVRENAVDRFEFDSRSRRVRFVRPKIFHCSRDDRTSSLLHANTSHGGHPGHADARRIQHTTFAGAVTDFDKRFR